MYKWAAETCSGGLLNSYLLFTSLTKKLS